MTPKAKFKVYHGYDRLFDSLSSYDVTFTKLMDLGDNADIDYLIEAMKSARKIGVSKVGFIVVPEDNDRTNNDGIIVTDPKTDTKTLYIYVEDPTMSKEVGVNG